MEASSHLPVSTDGVRARVSGQIDRVGSLSVDDFYRDYCTPRGGKPVIMTGLFNESGAPDRWTDDYIKAKMGSDPIVVYVSIDGTFRGGSGPKDAAKLRRVQMPISECFERMSGDPRHPPIIGPGEVYYVWAANPYENKFVQTLLADLPADLIYIPEAIRASAAVDKNLFLGPAGNITVPHYDQSDNLLCQARGRKRVLLWNPRQADLLYITPPGEAIDRHSEVDVQNPDLRKHPKFDRAGALEGILGPGDVLFIPSGWIHCVISLEFAVSVNMWWSYPRLGGFARFLLRKIVLYQYLLPLRPLRPELRSLVSYLVSERVARTARRVLGR